MSNSVMHVGIENPVERRKEVLSIAIDTIQALKSYELHKKTLREKNLYRRRFAQLMKEIKTLLEEFKGNLPEVHVPHRKKEEKAEKPKGVKKIPEVFMPRPKSPISKLESDIDNLRRKIAEL